MPRSVTDTIASPAITAVSIKIAPPFGEYLTALARRLLKTWNRSFASPTISIDASPKRSTISAAGTISRCKWQTSRSSAAKSSLAGSK